MASKLNYISKNKDFIFYYLLLSPLFDAITGLLIGHNLIEAGFIGAPTQVWRLFALFYFLFNLNYKKKSSLKIIVYMFFIFFVEFFAFYLYTQDIKAFFFGLNYGFKPIFLFTIFAYTDQKINSGELKIYDIIQCFILSTTIYASVVIFSFVTHTGLPSYVNGGFGTKGYFPSNNALSMLLGIGSLFALWTKNKKTNKYNTLFLLINIVGCMLIGAKTSLIFSFIVLVVYFFRSSFKIKIISFITIIFLLSIFYVQIQTLFNGIFAVVLFHAEHSQSENKFIEFIASSRDLFIKDALSHFDITKILITRFIWGAGVIVSFKNPFNLSYNYIYKNDYFNTLESDPADTFFYYGLIGLIIYILYFLTGIWKSINLNNRKYLIPFIIAYFFSFFAGHVVFDGMAGLVLPILYLSLKWKTEENLEK